MLLKLTSKDCDIVYFYEIENYKKNGDSYSFTGDKIYVNLLGEKMTINFSSVSWETLSLYSNFGTIILELKNDIKED